MTQNGMLNVLSRPIYDDSITSYETHTHQPYIASALGSSDEIRIPIQQQDLYTNIHDSFLLLEGKITAAVGDNNAAIATTLVTNPFAHLFEEIRYELNGHVIDKCKNVGITTTMKGYASFNESEAKTYWNYGGTFLDEQGNFSVCLPLKTLMGFPEHYDKIIVKAKHELVLLRAKNDDAMFQQEKAPQVELFRVHWHVKHVKVSDSEKMQLLNVEKLQKDIVLPFRSWDLYECPLIADSTKQTWMVKTATQMEKPRYVILGLQKNRKHISKNSSQFDHCDIIDVKLFLNSESYPYDNMNINFKQKQFEILYNMYANFQKSYLNRESAPLFDRSKFATDAPLVVIDCSKQIESVKSSSVDVRILIETRKPIPANTIAYALIIHDRVVQYNPFTNMVAILI